MYFHLYFYLYWYWSKKLEPWPGSQRAVSMTRLVSSSEQHLWLCICICICKRAITVTRMVTRSKQHLWLLWSAEFVAGSRREMHNCITSSTKTLLQQGTTKLVWHAFCLKKGVSPASQAPEKVRTILGRRKKKPWRRLHTFAVPFDGSCYQLHSWVCCTNIFGLLVIWGPIQHRGTTSIWTIANRIGRRKWQYMHWLIFYF